MIPLSQQDIERFRSRLERDDDGCLLFMGARTTAGYGSFVVGGKTFYAHRIAYELSGRTITKDRPQVLHSCDKPACCEPEHLKAGTDQDNRSDMARKRRGTGKGASLLPNGRWRARLHIRKVEIPLGCYATREEALMAIDRLRLQVYGQ